MPQTLRAVALTALAAFVLASFTLAGSAVADSAGSDPASNYTPPRLGAECNQPASAACIAAAVQVLDQARASLGQPAYRLPSNFATLTAAEQGFVLSNLDRIQYGLPPITGLTAGLNSDAMGGVRRDADPQPTAQNYLVWTANWAGGFANMPLAYEAWMYDDGPGSGNLDCTSGTTSGCWGHRHDVLFTFDPQGGSLAMGAAQGTDSYGETGYALLLFQGDPTFNPAYVYTWAQALAAGANAGGVGTTVTSTGSGAGANAGTGHRPAGAVPARVTIAVHLRGRHVTILAAIPRNARLQCAVTARAKHGWARDHYRACGARLTLARRRAGRYRLRVRAAGVVVTRYIRVR
jgi:hypothetical protein